MSPRPRDIAVRAAAERARVKLGSYMAGWRAEYEYRRDLLTHLAGELRSPPGREHPARAQLWLTWRLKPYLTVRMAGRGRLRVYCAGGAGRYVLLTSTGRMIGLGEGVAAAAAAILAGGVGRPSGESAGQAAAVQPGP